MLVYLLKKCCRHVIKNVVQILKKIMINGSLKNMLYKNYEKNKEVKQQSCMCPACMKKKGKMPSRHAPSVQALLNAQSCTLLNGSSDEEGQKGLFNRHLTSLANGMDYGVILG